MINVTVHSGVTYSLKIFKISIITCTHSTELFCIICNSLQILVYWGLQLHSCWGNLWLSQVPARLQHVCIMHLNFWVKNEKKNCQESYLIAINDKANCFVSFVSSFLLLPLLSFLSHISVFSHDFLFFVPLVLFAPFYPFFWDILVKIFEWNFSKYCTGNPK